MAASFDDMPPLLLEGDALPYQLADLPNRQTFVCCNENARTYCTPRRRLQPSSCCNVLHAQRSATMVGRGRDNRRLSIALVGMPPSMAMVQPGFPLNVSPSMHLTGA